MQNRIAVKHEKHEDGLNKKGEVVQSFNITVFLEMTQFKIPSGK